MIIILNNIKNKIIIKKDLKNLRVYDIIYIIVEAENMLKINANSKINLFLEITGKLPSGYHTVDTVMQSVSLSDSLELELIRKTDGIKITCDIPGIPTDERNIAFRTAQAYLEATDADCGIRIGIKKSIPSEAGMGGGSADGAAVLVGLNELCGNLLGIKELEAIASKYGADIPFCIEGGTKRLIGIGTDTAETFSSPELSLVIAKPDGGVSTPEAYRCLDKMFADFTDHQPQLPTYLTEILSGNNAAYSNALFNRFEYVLDELCPSSKSLVSYLRDNSHGSLLCGSGAAVFAIADSTAHAKLLADRVKSEYADCAVWTAETASRGCYII